VSHGGGWVEWDQGNRGSRETGGPGNRGTGEVEGRETMTRRRTKPYRRHRGRSRQPSPPAHRRRRQPELSAEDRELLAEDIVRGVDFRTWLRSQ
jgi:hypothetical protein